MPNWVVNVVTIDPEHRDKIDAVVASEENAFDFNNVIPMPRALVGGTAGSSSWDAVEIGNHGIKRGESLAILRWRRKKEGRKLLEPHPAWTRPSTREEIKGVIRRWYRGVDAALAAYDETGYHDWYNWSIDNWDTKWNACRAERTDTGYTFETAWSSPEAVIRELSRLVPGATIRVDYADEDWGRNVGTYFYHGGELEEEIAWEDSLASQVIYAGMIPEEAVIQARENAYYELQEEAEDAGVPKEMQSEWIDARIDGHMDAVADKLFDWADEISAFGPMAHGG